MSEPKHGVAAVVSGELRGTPTPENSGADAAEQLDLLGAQEAATPLGLKVRKPAGPGRPVGAQNRVTRDIRKLILAKHCHPLQAMAEIYSMDAKELATHLGCKPLEAMNLQLRAAAELAPYLAAKQAAVDDHGQAVMPTLVMNFGEGTRAPAATDGRRVLSIDAIARDAQQYQALSESERGGSHDDWSHYEAEGIEDADENDD
ncbi:hypothetical protein AncyloWKF20_05565 [Ancylobacter sp. WKF20]|uniref:hypothetical protein n=1 Tax=Ancylobacter sp. WKF20 TaxID=3039801 RepID=UPI002434668D|nr:hypothetical protein [Ancylobacter sp. WKF20]WGD31293.1 hypothetical protein AncyloWKF20_05565 [Ancylobacter sp. WKF20]